MKKLFLASSFADVAKLFTSFEGNLPGKTVSFIPTASKTETVTFYVNAGRKALEKMGLIIDELEISTASINDISVKIKNNDFIYITGGNTFYLLQELRRTGADEIIIDEINSGKLYIGESAGAIVVAPNIEYAMAIDNVKKAPDLENYDALGVVEFYTVPHYTNIPFKKATQKIIDTYSSVLNLIPINNKSAILVSNGKVEIERH